MTSPRLDWSDMDRQLRTHPGQWFRVATRKDLKSARTLRAELQWGRSCGCGQPRKFMLEQGQFAFEVRDDTDVWARYVGTEVPA